MCNDEFKYRTNEKRIITGTVFPENSNEAAVIISASFKLFPKFEENAVREGNCEFKGDKAFILLDLTDIPPGSYEVELTVVTAAERIIESQDIEVIGRR